MTLIIFVDSHKIPHNWTYTKKQEQEGTTQLRRIISSYPVPYYLKGVQKGSVYTIDKEISKENLQKELVVFLKQIKPIVKSTIPKNVIRSIGAVPLKKIIDPYLKDKVNAIWTFDVSYNPVLSIKDVMARQMIEDALKEEKITPGKTIIIEATSGNTGAGLALVAAYYGLITILVVPNKVSSEKISRLRKLGAHVIVTPTKVHSSDFKSYYSVRDTLGKMQSAWVPQQYDNPSNTRAHELTTGPQIWEQTKGAVTTVIVPTGTGGTISGIGHYLKRKNISIQIIGVDTIGSILYLLKQGYALEEVQHYAHSYDIQGFGEDIFPRNLDLSIIDKYIRISDISGLLMTQLLPALGFFQGQSSGASYAALLESIDKQYITKKDTVVVIFPDIAIPYRYDVFNDEWMKKKKFYVNY